MKPRVDGRRASRRAALRPLALLPAGLAAGLFVHAAVWGQAVQAPASPQVRRPLAAAPLRDPFERPAAPRAAPAGAGVGEGSSDGADASAPPPAWVPELRAVMYQRGRSLVNISGSVLAVGETVHGYRLVRVAERSAVIARDGITIQLTLDNREPAQ